MRTIITAMLLALAATRTYAEDVMNTVSPEETTDGFVGLFDGKSLDGWTGNLKGCHLADGTLVSEHGNQYTEKDYANFILRFEFTLPAGGNNGIGIRTPPQGDAAYVGMEIQILDDGNAAYKDIQPWQAHGSIYGVVAAKRGFLKSAGEWNQEEIIADGSHIKVTLNGHVITDADIGEIKDTIDGHHHPGLHNPEGRIACLGHTGPIAFRNIRIKTLPR